MSFPEVIIGDNEKETERFRKHVSLVCDYLSRVHPVNARVPGRPWSIIVKDIIKGPSTMLNVSTLIGWEHPTLTIWVEPGDEAIIEDKR